jgi:hypothetical protein
LGFKEAPFRSQQIAMVDTETGEQTEKKLTPAEAVQFYSELQGPVLVGMEACGSCCCIGTSWWG